jgi:mannose-1-phosphate guanylyltransferase
MGAMTRPARDSRVINGKDEEGLTVCTSLESLQYPMSALPERQLFWAVILAGGDGGRLQGLTRKIAGDSRPKQFCSLFGGKSLLIQTRERIERLFSRDRTTFVVTRDHERYYREDLAGVIPSRILVQPRNRGTGVAIAAALTRILQYEPNPFVTFFPCDHYYSNDDAFASTIRSAMISVQEYPRSLVLVGAEPHYPEIEYGWIEPRFAIRTSGGAQLLTISRFWEKPSLVRAQELLGSGSLWNTFITAGRANTLLELLRSQIPDVMDHVAAGVSHDNPDGAYGRTRPVDFSSEILAQLPQRLLVVRGVESGWADLGNPARLIDTLLRNGIEPDWLTEMRAIERRKSQ